MSSNERDLPQEEMDGSQENGIRGLMLVCDLFVFHPDIEHVLKAPVFLCGLEILAKQMAWHRGQKMGSGSGQPTGSCLAPDIRFLTCEMGGRIREHFPKVPAVLTF